MHADEGIMCNPRMNGITLESSCLHTYAVEILETIKGFSLSFAIDAEYLNASLNTLAYISFDIQLLLSCTLNYLILNAHTLAPHYLRHTIALGTSTLSISAEWRLFPSLCDFFS